MPIPGNELARRAWRLAGASACALSLAGCFTSPWLLRESIADCRQGDERACAYAAWQVDDDERAELERLRTEALISNCERSSEDCGPAAQRLWADQPERALALAMRACADGGKRCDREARRIVGDAAFLGVGREEDRKEATSIYAALCADGDCDRSRNPESALCDAPNGYREPTPSDRNEKARAALDSGDPRRAYELLLASFPSPPPEAREEAFALMARAIEALVARDIRPRLREGSDVQALLDWQKLVAPVPADHPSRRELEKARAEAARRYADRARALGSTRPAAATVLGSISVWLGGDPGPAQDWLARVPRLSRPAPALALTTTCPWLRPNLAGALHSPNPGERSVSAALEVSCSEDSSEKSNPETYQYTEQVTRRVQRTVTKFIERYHAMTCTKTIDCSRPGCPTVILNYECGYTEQIPVEEVVWEDVVEEVPHTATRQRTVRTFVATLKGRLKVGDRPEIPVALDAVVADTREETHEGTREFEGRTAEEARRAAATLLADLVGRELDALHRAALDQLRERGRSATDRDDSLEAFATVALSEGSAESRAPLAPMLGLTEPQLTAALSRESFEVEPPPAAATGRVAHCPEPFRPSGARSAQPIGLFALRGGLGSHLGILGVGLEFRPIGRVGIAVGTGTHALSGGLSFGLDPRWDGGPYLDLHATWVRSGLLGRSVGEGLGFGATAGWDFRIQKVVTIKVGGGVAKNSARPDKGGLGVLDLSAGVMF